MKTVCIAAEQEISVHPVGGMQLSEGYIRKDKKGFSGNLPGLAPLKGECLEEVLRGLEQEAKKYYGDDVVVEVMPDGVAV